MKLGTRSRTSCLEVCHLVKSRVFYTILAHECDCGVVADEGQVERLAERVHASRARNDDSRDDTRMLPRDVHHFLRDSPVDGHEETADGRVGLIASNDGKGDAPGDPALCHEIRTAEEGGRSLCGGDAEAELPSEGRSMWRLVIVEEPTDLVVQTQRVLFHGRVYEGDSGTSVVNLANYGETSAMIVRPRHEWEMIFLCEFRRVQGVDDGGGAQHALSSGDARRIRRSVRLRSAYRNESAQQIGMSSGHSVYVSSIFSPSH